MSSGEGSEMMTQAGSASGGSGASGGAGELAAAEVWLAGTPEPSAWWGVATLGAWALAAVMVAGVVWGVVWWVTRPAETRAWVVLSLAAGRWPGGGGLGWWPFVRGGRGGGGTGGGMDEAARVAKLERAVQLHLRV